MRISSDAKTILNKYKEAINNGDFESIYNDLLMFDRARLKALTSEISQIFLNSGINPLNYLDEVPAKFLIRAEIDSITIPNGITKIKNFAFPHTNLTRIEIPDSVTYMGINAFYHCANLKYIKFSKNVEIIPRGACANCVSLEFAYLPDKLKIIDENAFNGCIKWQDIVLPRGIKNIGSFALPGNLKHAYYDGIKEQWKNVIIDIDNPFFKSVNPTIVHCNDGDLVIRDWDWVDA